MSASQPIEWTVAQLAQAVERGQLELHYQPIVDLRSEQIVGAEALLRWRHPTLGLLPPGQIGVRFAADDFGTGYSCLQHLKCCPISTLKIDQSFVAGLANDHRDQTIVRTVIQLAHGLGMEVVAEGVETSASLDLLRQADCDTGQGFLFAKPMPAAAFAVFVSQWRGATMNANDPTATSCCVCCKEIPLDAAFTPEGAEYVEHFCGLECYQRFQARAKTGSETDADPNACDSSLSD
ncbi:DUF3330 domain-containing protein [Pseudomonas aeruginosa]|uniref:DUF3330 domain-containing protein n=1 Tax=Pseudomonas aeruginosa TaxID=287 RepID=UPI001049F3F2|nr:DUF3330 domain-containing protein [Pseudomonas aeruginosa]